MFKGLELDYRQYCDTEIEALDDGNTTIVHDLASNKYYAMSSKELPKLSGWIPYISRVSPRFERIYIILTIMLCCVVLTYYYWDNNLNLNCLKQLGWLLVICYCIVQVFLHECGHIAALHYFGKKPDKMGFRMNFYVFPAFYVRMNQAHLLTRGERAIVHSSGLFANCMIVIIVAVITRIIDYPQLFMANWIFTGGLIANMTPLLNADGYKLLVTLLGLNEAKHINRKHPVILTLRLLSIFVILWYFWTIWLTLKKEFAF